MGKFIWLNSAPVVESEHCEWNGVFHLLNSHGVDDFCGGFLWLDDGQKAWETDLGSLAKTGIYDVGVDGGGLDLKEKNHIIIEGL